VSHLNQLWVFDIIYIRFQREFAYLAVLWDAFSRRLISWALAAPLPSTPSPLRHPGRGCPPAPSLFQPYPSSQPHS
jgi:hypothetical protein